MLINLLGYSAGYLTSILLGHIMVLRTVDVMTRKLQEQYPSKIEDRNPWLPAAMGFVERALYTTSWLSGKSEFIAIWLGFKSINQWGRWSIVDSRNKDIVGRGYFYIFLIGNLLSIVYGLIGGFVSMSIKNYSGELVDSYLFRTIFVVLVILLLNMVFIFWVGKQKNSVRN